MYVKTKNMLRWVALFPAVIIGAIVIFYVSFYFGIWSAQSFIPFQIEKGDVIHSLTSVCSAIFSYIVVREMGIYIAPSNKKTVGVIIAIIAAFLMITNLVASIKLMTERTEYCMSIAMWMGIIANIAVITVTVFMY
jgi:hypothetical protein